MTPPRLAVDRASSVAPWIQVHDGVVRLIERGGLRPGERVPTVRALAADLDLAPNTVARAYRELETAGWLVGRGRAGTFVADVPPTDPETQLRHAAADYLRRARALGFDADTAVRAVEAARP
jgi:GntR family transcriptional regulator